MSNKRAVIYCRVSTDEQSAKGYSLPSQLAACKRYAEKCGMVIVGEFSDDYSGATPIEYRPEGSKAMAMLSNGEADVLIVFSIDRLVRPKNEADEWDTAIMIRGLSKAGCELHTTDFGKRDTSFIGLLLAVLEAKGAGDERRKILERTMRGKATKAASGKVICQGIALYGYRYNEERNGFIVNEAEASVVRMVYQWYTQGDESGARLGIKGISQRLNEIGIPSPAAARGKTVRRGWDFSNLRRVLSNESYCGDWHYLKANKSGEEREHIIVKIPAIVSREVWEQAQRQRAVNKSQSRRNAKEVYLLRGRVRCGVCGGGVAGTSYTRNGKIYRYYECWQSRRGFSDCTKYYNADKLESAAWQFCLQALSDAATFERALIEAQAQRQIEAEPKQERLALVCGMLAECEANARRLADSMAGAGNGIVYQSLQQKASELDAQHKRLAAERDRLTSELDAQALGQVDINASLAMRESVLRAIDTPSEQTILDVFNTLNLQVVLLGDNKVKMSVDLSVVSTVIDLHNSRSTQVNRKIPLAKTVSLADILFSGVLLQAVSVPA